MLDIMLLYVEEGKRLIIPRQESHLSESRTEDIVVNAKLENSQYSIVKKRTIQQSFMLFRWH